MSFPEAELELQLGLIRQGILEGGATLEQNMAVEEWREGGWRTHLLAMTQPVEPEVSMLIRLQQAKTIQAFALYSKGNLSLSLRQGCL